MMKKCIFYTILFMFILSCAAAVAQTGNSITLRKFFPAPVSAYSYLRLIPQEYRNNDSNSNDWDLDETASTCEPGEIIYHAPYTEAFSAIPTGNNDAYHTYTLFICQEGNPNYWDYISGPWSHTPLNEALNGDNAGKFDVYNTAINTRVTANSAFSKPADAEFKLHLDDNASILAIGLSYTENYAELPESGQNYSNITYGEGTRLLWYPKKSALRAGRVEDAGANYWNDSNIADFSVALGHNTQSSAEASMVFGGEGNLITQSSDNHSVVAGGRENTFLNGSSPYSSIAGGATNQIDNSPSSFIGGGESNVIKYTPMSVIFGGNSNKFSDYSYDKAKHSVIGGGLSNYITHRCTNACSSSKNFPHTIIGGVSNTILTANAGSSYIHRDDEANSVIGGGQNNNLYAYNSVVIGGKSNGTTSSHYYQPFLPLYYFESGGYIYTYYAIVAGGENNTITGSGYNMIGGGGGNSITYNDYSTILGGEGNTIPPSGNTSTMVRSVIVGGQNNSCDNEFDQDPNTLDEDATSCFIGGGSNNESKGGFIGGGYANKSYAYQAGIGGGYNNIIGKDDGSNPELGWGSYIPGGHNVKITGKGSWASGQNVTLHTNYSFLWGISSSNIAVGTEENNAASPVFIITNDSQDMRVGIQTTTPQEALDVKGSVRIDGKIYLTNIASASIATMEGNGGEKLYIQENISPNIGLDLAEYFKSNETLNAGTLVMADEKTGALIEAVDPYNPKVVGVISTSPAITFNGNRVIMNPDPDSIHGKEGRAPLALKGRVPVKVSLENGPIEAGDPLTSSSTPGHAMKATDAEKSWGTIIGKALQGFSGGPNGEREGEILVFVTLY